MMKKAKIVFLLILALVFAVQGIGMPTAKADVIPDLTVDYIFDGLGDALSYGVVAREWTQNAHAETSVCIDVMYKNHPDPFLNTDTTYLYSKEYPLVATVSAPAGESLQGMQFALFMMTNSGLQMQEETIVTIDEDTNATVIGWDLGTGDLTKQKLYVRQVESDGYGGYIVINDGEKNDEELKVTYGSGLTNAAPNDNYIGNLKSNMIGPNLQAPDSLSFFNTSSYYPRLELGSPIEAGYWYGPGNFWIDILDQNRESNEDKQLRITFTYAGYMGMGWVDMPMYKYYSKFDGIWYNYDKDTGERTIYRSRDGATMPVDIVRASSTTYADSLLDKAEAISTELGNMKGGTRNFTGTTDAFIAAEPSLLGNSTTTGPEDGDGNVVSLYNLNIGEDNKLTRYDFAKLNATDPDYDGFHIAPNEYVVMNVICNDSGKDATGKRTGTVYMPEAGQMKMRIAPNTWEQVNWGKVDSGAADRILFNFIYYDEASNTYKPYEGKIVPQSEHGGTILAPKAHVDVVGSPPNGGIIADSVYNEKEIHQRTMTAKEQSTWIRMEGEEEVVTGAVKIVKVQGTTMSKLPGAKFALYEDKACTQKISEKETGAQGEVLFENLAAGIYYVKETAAPEGYVLDTTVYTVAVRAGETTFVGNKGYVTNTVGRGTLTLTKVDADDSSIKLPGAIFALYTQESSGAFDEDQAKLVQTLTTNSSGKITVRVEAGDYWIKEIESPFGYDLGMSQAQKITVRTGETTVVETGNGVVTNEKLPTGTLKVTKVDLEKPSTKLDNAEFAVYLNSNCTKKVSTFKTANGGVATVDLPIGTYWVKEITAPNGYLLDDATKYEVEIFEGQVTELGENGLVTNEIIKGTAKLQKAGMKKVQHPYGIDWDYSSAKRLAGAEFTVYDGNGDIVASALTDDKGEITFELAPGHYWIKETKAPIGYELDDTWEMDFWVQAGREEKISGTLNMPGYDAAIVNAKKSGTGALVLYKTNSTGETPLNGAEFKVFYDEACENPVTNQVFVTKDVAPREKGRLDIEGLDPGIYYLLEVKAPTGYALPSPNKSIKVEIKEGETTRVNGDHGVVTNTGYEDELTSVSVTKKWDHTGNPAPSRDPEAEIQLLADGNEMRGPKYTVKLKGEASHTWKDLPKYRYDDEADEWVEIVYTVVEKNGPENYRASISSSGKNELVVTNTYIQQDQKLELEIPVTKALAQGSGKTDEVFTFELAQVSDPPGPLPADGDILASVKGAGDATEDTFGKIVIDYETFDSHRQGYPSVTYGWTVRELIPADASDDIEYDGTVYHIQATVFVAEDGKMSFGYKDDEGNLVKSDKKVEVFAEDEAGNSEYVDIDFSKGDRLVFTNNVKITSISVKKEWDDNDDQAGKRPAEVSVQLLANGVAKGDPVKLSEGNKWAHTWDKLAVKDSSGKEIAYSVQESPVSGYTGTVTGNKNDGFVITNTYQTAAVQFSATKVLQNGTLQAGQFTFLLKDEAGNLLQSKTNAADGSVTFDPISYTQDDLGGATTKQINYTIHESIPQGAVDNGDGTFVLDSIVYDGKEHIVTAVLSYNPQEGVLTVLPGYNTEDGSAPTFTNTYDGSSVAPASRYAKVVKVWDDNNNAAGKRPESVSVKLLVNGVPQEPAVVLNAANNWTHEWLDLVATDAAGNMIQYDVAEDPVAGYTSKVTLDTENPGTYIITNSKTTEEEKTYSVELEKADKLDPSKKLLGAVYTLYTNQACLPEHKYADVTTGQDGTAKLENVPAGTYWVKETIAPDGYQIDPEAYPITVPNPENPDEPVKVQVKDYPETSVAVKKVWEGVAEGTELPEITVQLMADGKAVEGKTLKLNAACSWAGEFTELDSYDELTDKAIVYTVEEIAVEGYAATVTGDAKEGFTITNTKATEEEKISITVTKVWEDNNNAAGVRPDYIQVVLSMGGGRPPVDGIKVLNAENNWTYTWNDVPVYDGSGNLLKYTVIEKIPADAAKHYVGTTTATENGFILTNTYVAEEKLGQLSLSKTVVADSKTNDSFLFDIELSRTDSDPVAGSYEATLNGIATEKVTFVAEGKTAKATVSLKDGETLVIRGLRAGTTYLVSEQPNKLYDVQINGVAATSAQGTISDTKLSVAKFQNTLKLVGFTVKKEWTGLAEGETAPAIKLTLYCNGKAYPAVTPAPDKNGWYTYTNLPAYVDGKLAVYTVKEEPVTGFTTTYLNKGENAAVTDCAHNGSTIVNSKIPQTGDTAPLTLWMLTALLAVFGLAAVTAKLRKREN